MPEQIEVPTLPEVTIIQDGKQVDTSAIDNYDSFMSWLIQASMAANIAKIRKYYDDRVSRGEIQYYRLNVTGIEQEIQCTPPGQSLYVENYGPSQLYITINSSNRIGTPIPVNRAVYFPFDTHVIERFYIATPPGTIATGSAILKY
jgi:hypothetical protein